MVIMIGRTPLPNVNSSPGGTTISAIRELERHGVRAAFLAAIEAARDRGRELGADPGAVTPPVQGA